MERRKDDRLEVEIPLSFSGSEATGGGLVTSLSRHGCSVISEDQVRPRSYLALRLQLPNPNVALKVEVAEVRWASTTGFGVEFRHLQAEEQERLNRFVSWLQQTQNN